MKRRQPRRGATAAVAQGFLMMLWLVTTPGRPARADQDAPAADAPPAPSTDGATPVPAADDVQIEMPLPPAVEAPPPPPAGARTASPRHPTHRGSARAAQDRRHRQVRR